MEKTNEAFKLWMVVRHKETGDFKNAKLIMNSNDIIDTVFESFDAKYPDYQVIHFGEGELPPKTYRSLEYVKD